jgi:hypothetical protein
MRVWLRPVRRLVLLEDRDDSICFRVSVFRYNQNAVVYRAREWIELNVWSRRESVVKVNFKVAGSSDCLS